MLAVFPSLMQIAGGSFISNQCAKSEFLGQQVGLSPGIEKYCMTRIYGLLQGMFANMKVRTVRQSRTVSRSIVQETNSKDKSGL